MHHCRSSCDKKKDAWCDQQYLRFAGIDLTSDGHCKDFIQGSLYKEVNMGLRSSCGHSHKLECMDQRIERCPTVSLLRSTTNCRKRKVSLQGFVDASKSAVCATIYAVVTYLDGSTEQNLLAAKSRIAPRDLSIPRLELVAAHMLAKLARHVNTVVGLIDIEVDMWSDSMTTLYWLASKGTWSQFVRNRVQAIKVLGEWG